MPSSLTSSQIAADRRQPGEPAEIDRGLGMAGAHEHAAVPGDQREDVAGPHEIGSAHVVVGEAAHRVACARSAEMPVVSAVPEVDRDREGGAVRRVVVGHHRLEAQPARLRAVSGAQTMPQVWRMMKAIFSGVQCDGRDDQVALVLAVVVVGDDDDLAAREGPDGFDD